MEPITLQQIETLLGKAVSKFEGQGSDIDTLKASVKEMKDAVAAVQSRNLVIPGTKMRAEDIWTDPSQAKRFSQFLRAVYQKDFETIQRVAGAQNETTNADGGYTVPEEFSNALIRIVENYGVFRREARVIPMSREVMKIPALLSGLTAYWPDENVDMTTAMTSKAAFDQKSMTAKKMAVMVGASMELLDDSNIAIPTLLATLAGEAIAAEEDRVGFMGDTDASDAFDGCVHACTNETPMGSGKNTFADVSASDLLSLTGTITPGSQIGAKFYMHRSIFDLVRSLRVESTSGNYEGSYIYNAPGDPSTPGTIWGYPYVLVDQMPGITTTNQGDTRFILFGNLKNCVYLGSRSGLQASMNENVGWAAFQTWWRFAERISVATVLPGNLAVLATAS